MTGKWGSVSEAVSHYRKSERTIRRWVSQGQLTARKEGNRLLILLDDKTPPAPVSPVQSEEQRATGSQQANAAPPDIDRQNDQAEIKRLHELLEEVRAERDYLRQAHAAALSKIPQIEARASDPESRPAEQDPVKRRRWWEVWKG